MYQNMHISSHRKLRKERTFTGIMAENFPNLIIIIIYKNIISFTSKKLNELKLKQVHTEKHYNQTVKQKREF